MVNKFDMLSSREGLLTGATSNFNFQTTGPMHFKPQIKEGPRE